MVEYAALIAEVCESYARFVASMLNTEEMGFQISKEGEWISRRLVPSLLLNKLASALMHVNCEVFLVWE